MVKVDAIEGTSDNALWYHYDVSNDVLYLRFASERDTPTYAEEDDGGLIVLRRETDDAVIGLTVVNWWKNFGRGKLPDSLLELERAIEPWTKKLAA